MKIKELREFIADLDDDLEIWAKEDDTSKYMISNIEINEFKQVIFNIIFEDFDLD